MLQFWFFEVILDNDIEPDKIIIASSLCKWAPLMKEILCWDKLLS